MQNISVGTTETTVLAAGYDRQGRTVVLQNQSDTSMRLAIGSANAALLTASVGLLLEPGDAMSLSGGQAQEAVSAIHGGSGSKTLHAQVV